MIMSTIEPIRKRKLSEKVLERLVRMIERGELKPGDHTPSERELMDRFQVGRTSVREAMQSLANMGLITINHGERAQVAALTPQSIIEQIYRPAKYLLATSPQILAYLREARALFEAGIVREATAKASPEGVEALGKLVQAMKDNLENNEAFIRADMEFHKTLAQIGGNPFFTVVSEAMMDWLADFRKDMVHATGLEKLTLAEHEQILSRIESVDPDGAAGAMSNHIKRTNELYRRLDSGGKADG